MRKIVMIAILVVSMVQGVFAQQIIIKGTVKDATSKKGVSGFSGLASFLLSV